MSIQTNLHGRLRNTPLNYNRGLMPLFEAVVNSIHSIEELSEDHESSKIVIEILRDSQASLDLENVEVVKENIVGFKIIDTGIGFNDVNMKSFETLDSEHKASKGCRGVGRLLWLKAFRKVEVESVFKEGAIFKLRKFSFDATKGVDNVEDKDIEEVALKTTVILSGFDEKYRAATCKNIDTISKSLLEHCLWYFVRDAQVPKIIVRDGSDVIDLDELYDVCMYSSSHSERLEIKDHSFEITHIKFLSSSNKNHEISYCAANRLVKEEGLSGKIPGLNGKLGDENGDFIYSCYISSSYLDDKVRSERTGFDLAESDDGIFSSTEISLSDIRSAVFPAIQEHLSEYLTANIEAGNKRINEFVSNKAPRYRPILSHIPEGSLIVDYNISDKELDLLLHKHLSEIERKMLDSGHNIMRPKNDEGVEEYQARLKEYLKTAEDIKKSDLANYVSHRKVILDLLEAAIQRGADGKYAREDLIHELIMPMRCESDDVFLDSCNLWLLDERLAFHNYLASDKTLSSMPITGSDETKEPDICALNVADNPILVSDSKNLPLASIVVVEIKRPMRNDAGPGEDKDPVEQALGYLNRIRSGSVYTSTGRPIPNSEDIPGYCYIICDITESVKKRCQMLDLTITSDYMGYFGFHKQFKSYIEVVSFDRLVNAAKQRNKAFFDKLGLPT